MTRIKKTAEKTLGDLLSVKITLAIASTMILSSSLIIAASSNLQFDFSYEGFNFIFTAFRFPLAVAAATLPILGFIAAMHRSAQTNLQIEKAIEQNTFSNYYKHNEAYHSHFNKFSFPTHIRNKITEELIQRCYERTFQQNNPSNFSVEYDIKWLKVYTKDLAHLLLLLKYSIKEENASLRAQYYDYMEIIENALRQKLFGFRGKENRIEKVGEGKTIALRWEGKKHCDITLANNPRTAMFERLTDYLRFIANIKTIAGSKENSDIRDLKLFYDVAGLVNEYNGNEIESIMSGTSPLIRKVDQTSFSQKQSEISKELEELLDSQKVNAR